MVSPELLMLTVIGVIESPSGAGGNDVVAAEGGNGVICNIG